MSAVPLCRCRVLYIGSSVPTVTKDGLQGIQQPLRERYPVKENSETKGIDSCSRLSVWSNGLLLEYVDGNKKTESAFFQISTLHYCAAVRYVNVSGFSVSGGGERFIPLDTPFANIPDSPHPPIFAAIFRRTSGVKVLECHAFICTNDRAANALVRCCFHSYADTMYLKMDEKLPGLKTIKEASRSATPSSEQNTSEQENGTHDIVRDEAEWNERAIGQKTWQRRQQSGEYDTASISSSLFKNQKKRHSRKGDSRSDVVDHGLIVPFVENEYSRRAGSQSDVRGPEYYDSGAMPFGYERGAPMPFYGPPPPHMMGRPPFRPFPPGMMPPPPPHMFRPPPGGFMPFPPPPPHFFAPPPQGFGGRMVPLPFPPFMAPPRGMFMPPPFGPMSPHPFAHQMERPKTPTATGGPIIESIYDTFPRRGNYEEPIYTSSNNGAPTQSRIKPGSVAPEYYEGYYETYGRRHRTPEKKNGSRSDSDVSADESSQFWNDYEAGIYRKAHLNEKAFGSALARSNGHEDKANGEDGAQPTTSKHAALDSSTPISSKRDAIRPVTPPADYDQDASNAKDRDHSFTHTKRTAVF